MSAETHIVRAKNISAESENKIHDDDVARRFGFSGGLVPGAEVFSYLSHLAAARWGEAFFREGAMSARFLEPVYDGEAAEARGERRADGGLDLTLWSGGRLCARGMARLERAVPERLERQPLIGYWVRPPASPLSLVPGMTLGTVLEPFTKAGMRGYLADTGEDHPLYTDELRAAPGWLTRLANNILAANVHLGPWIHVESDIRLHRPLTDEGLVETRARVAALFERAGHRFVTLDFVSMDYRPAGDGEPFVSGRHTAIYEPRQVREAGS